MTTKKEFIEILNWKEAQPKMKAAPQTWMKLYTSLLDNEAFERLSDPDRLLVIGIWLTAARMGTHILPADPKWLFRKIGFLREIPCLDGILNATNNKGQHKPFIRYYDPAEAAKEPEKEAVNDNKKAEKPKKVKSAAPKKQKAKNKNRTEEKRTEQTDSYRNPEEKREEENKTGLNPVTETQQKEHQNPKSIAQRQIDALMQTSQQNSEQKPVKPENPKESDVGAVSTHHVPKQPQSAYRGGGLQHIGRIISGIFPQHWQDGDCEQFGWEIVDAIGYSTYRQNSHSRSEWGAFAAWWSRLKAAVPGMICDEIRQIAVKKALFLNSPKARSARNKSAVWFKIMDGELLSRGITLHDTRASPAM